MSEKPRPCPFCGSIVDFGRNDWAEVDRWWFLCQSCGFEASIMTNDRAYAIAAYNRRHASPAVRHVAEKVRNAIRAGMTIDVFGAKRLTGVVLDLEAAEEFVKEVEEDEGV